MDIIERIDKELKESTGEYCHFFKAKDKKWYYILGTTNYGPFDDIDSAEDHLSNYHANPGGWSVDRSGRMPAPKNPFKMN